MFPASIEMFKPLIVPVGVVAIELDDSSHQKAKRRQRDDFLNQAFQSADIPLHRFKVQKQYDPQRITEKLKPTENQNIKL